MEKTSHISHHHEPQANHESLSQNILPRHYRLFLRVNLEDRSFAGNQTITLDINEPATEITLNALDLAISNTLVYPAGGTDPFPANVTYDPERGRAIFALPQKVSGEGINLSMKFNGQLNKSLVGLYESKYAYDGQERCMAVSQFEAPHARRMFPCFDQPDMKATFELTLDVPENCVAITNGELTSSTEIGEGRRVDNFAVTPKMSTYILAVVVGQMECFEKVSKTGTRLRVYATPGKAEQGLFALDATDRILAFFKDYFGIAYALPKLDQIAVPDFAFGAMENWGAIVYRESGLLVGPDSSRAQLQRAAEYLAHEIAHQWFGNLVTMKWWDDLWLNEAFATFMGTKCVDALFPEYGIWPQFVNHEYGSGMDLDALKSTHPVHVPVPAAAQIDEIFDAISYNKGGSLLRMLESYIGADGFRDGVRAYMASYAYANTEAADLWTCFEEATGKPVRDLMREWIEQPGYPLLTVSATQESERDNGLVLVQGRFRLDDAVRPDIVEMPIWKVPVGIRTANGRETVLLGDQTMNLKVASGAGFAFLNADRAGFYRVRYDAATLPGILAAVLDGRLNTEERIGVEDDAFALCRSGVISVAEYLEIAGAFVNETEYAVWGNLLGHLGEIRAAFATERDVARRIDRLSRQLIASTVKRLGWEHRDDDSHGTVKLRSMALAFAGGCGDDGVCKAAIELFESAESRNAIRPDIRPVVYTLAVSDGNDDRHRELKRLFSDTESHEEKSRLLGAMGSAKSLVLRGDTLSFMMTDAVRGQDAPMALMAVARSSDGDTLAWQFVRDHWDAIAKRHEGNNQLLGYYVTASGSCLYDHGEIGGFREFFETKNPAGLERTVAQAIETATRAADWKARNLDSMRTWAEGYDG